MDWEEGIRVIMTLKRRLEKQLGRMQALLVGISIRFYGKSKMGGIRLGGLGFVIGQECWCAEKKGIVSVCVARCQGR